MRAGAALAREVKPRVAYPSGNDAGVAMTDIGPALLAESEPANGTESRGPMRAAQAGAGARWPYWLAALVCVIGLVATGVLVWISASTYDKNENPVARPARA